jgi:two-component system response regulator FixJ
MRDAKVKVFVVDDDEAIRDSLTLLLGLHGFDVETYSSTAAFIAGYSKPARGCLLLDQHLRGEAGLDFVRSTRGKSLGIPVILMSGRGDAMLAALAKREGCTTFLEKPIPEQTLIGAIRQAAR